MRHLVLFCLLLALAASPVDAAGRHKVVNGVTIPYTAEEETARDAREATTAANKPTRDWSRAMKKARRKMPAWFEAHIEKAHGGVAGDVDQQADYNAIKTLRDNKP